MDYKKSAKYVKSYVWEEWDKEANDIVYKISYGAPKEVDNVFDQTRLHFCFALQRPQFLMKAIVLVLETLEEAKEPIANDDEAIRLIIDEAPILDYQELLHWLTLDDDHAYYVDHHMQSKTLQEALKKAWLEWYQEVAIYVIEHLPIVNEEYDEEEDEETEWE